LKDFRRKVSTAGRYQYEARVGRHDDLVLAVAIALWSCVGRPVQPAAQFGSYGPSVPSNHLGQGRRMTGAKMSSTTNRRDNQ
jgi:hypothetical protein